MEHNNAPRRPKFTRIALLITYAAILFGIAYRPGEAWAAVKWFFSALSPLFSGLLLAYLFHMPIDFYYYKLLGDWDRDARYRKFRLAVSMLLGYISVALFLYGLGAIVLPPVVESISILVANFSNYMYGFESWLDGTLSSLSVSPALSSITDGLWEQAAGQIRSVLSSVASGAVNFTLSFTSGITNMILALVFSIFLLGSRSRVFNGVKLLGFKLLGEKRTNEAIRILAMSDNVFSSYILGKIVDSVMLGIVCFICMRLFKVEFAPILSVVIGASELVPIVGPFIGTVACAFLLLMINPAHVIVFVLIVVIAQTIQSNVIYPHIMGSAVGLPAVWVILSIIVAGGLFGFWGMLLGTPLFAVAYKLANEQWGIDEQGQGGGWQR